MFQKFSNRYEYDVKQACLDVGFRVPKVFHRLSNEAITMIWNGIGAKGAWYNKYIPKRVLGLNIQLPSCPHDIGYQFGESEEYKKRVDKDFKYNLFLWIDKYSKFKWLARLRKRIAYGYYLSVKYFGHDAFWKHKETVVED